MPKWYYGPLLMSLLWKNPETGKNFFDYYEPAEPPETKGLSPSAIQREADCREQDIHRALWEYWPDGEFDSEDPQKLPEARAARLQTSEETALSFVWSDGDGWFDARNKDGTEIELTGERLVMELDKLLLELCDGTAPIEVYTDAGLCEDSPSKVGGAYGYVIAFANQGLIEGSGIILPEHLSLPAVTNNAAEYAGLLVGLRALKAFAPPGTHTLKACPDSKYAINKWKNPGAIESVPASLVEYARDTRKLYKGSGVNLQFELIGGHPNPEELKSGYQIKESGNRFRVSRHNKRCDTLEGQACKSIATLDRATIAPPDGWKTFQQGKIQGALF